MPTDPGAILFITISNLTGGLISDITTLLVAILTLSFICMGVDRLLQGLGSSMNLRISDSLGRKAGDVLAERNLYQKGTHSYDLANAEYRALISKSSRLRLKGLGHDD